MFTEQQITAAHAKMRSGADYPKYVQELKQMGMSHYDFIVENGSNVFYGENGFSIATAPKYSGLLSADASSAKDVKHTIAIHQQGQTDFATFCRQVADAGIVKWTSDLNKMAVIYYDKLGEAVVTEPIPGAKESY